MTKLVMNIVLTLIAMNLAMYLGTMIAGRPFEFNFFFSAIMPIICAFVAWETDKNRAKQH